MIEVSAPAPSAQRSSTHPPCWTVSRIVAKSSNHDMHLTLDVSFPPRRFSALSLTPAPRQINVDLLPLTQGEAFSLALSSSLLPEGAKATDAGGWRAGIDGGLADDWEYVMYGKVYKFDQDTKDSVYAFPYPSPPSLLVPTPSAPPRRPLRVETSNNERDC